VKTRRAQREKKSTAKLLTGAAHKTGRGMGTKGQAPKLQGSSSSLPLMKCAKVSSWGS
jgi:hypothetical protein